MKGEIIKITTLIVDEARSRPLPEDGDIVRAIYSVFIEVGMELNNILKEKRENERDNLLPESYTSEEGGKIFPWPSDTYIPMIALNTVELGQRSIMIYGHQVHSLLFKHNIRWDTINGWELI